MNTKLWIVVGILIVAAGFFWFKNSSTANPYASPASSYSSKPVASATPSRSGTGTKATATPVAKTYTQLVAEYVNRVLQFNDSCQVSPKSFVLKNNMSVLLDNRSAQPKMVMVDGKSYSLAAYGYQIVTLSSATLPKAIGINCGSSVNVGTINLQADISGQ